MWIIHLDVEIDQSEIKSQTERSILSRCLVPQLMWRGCPEPRILRGTICGIARGMSLSTKNTSLYVYAIVQQ